MGGRGLVHSFSRYVCIVCNKWFYLGNSVLGFLASRYGVVGKSSPVMGFCYMSRSIGGYSCESVSPLSHSSSSLCPSFLVLNTSIYAHLDALVALLRESPQTFLPYIGSGSTTGLQSYIPFPPRASSPNHQYEKDMLRSSSTVLPSRTPNSLVIGP